MYGLHRPSIFHRNRAYIYYSSTAVFLHLPECTLSKKKWCLCIQSKCFIPGFCIQIENVFGSDHSSSVINKNIHPAKLIDKRIHYLFRQVSSLIRLKNCSTPTYYFYITENLVGFACRLIVTNPNNRSILNSANKHAKPSRSRHSPL